MIKQNLPYMIMISLASVASLVVGLYGLLNRGKINFYRSINILINGIILSSLSIFYIYNILNWTGTMSKDFFYKLITIGMTIFFFIGGMYGVLNKEKINDPIAFGFSRMAVILSIMYTIGLVAFWLKWHH